MPKHIPAYDNKNTPIVDVQDTTVPLCYVNRIALAKGQTHSFNLAEYETCIVIVSGSCSVTVDDTHFANLGGRKGVWDGEPDSVYVPRGAQAEIVAQSDGFECFVGGGKCEQKLSPFVVKAEETGHIQYGSDDTKTHRRITHILGQNVDGQVDRLLISELHTVGAGGWSGFPSHKHDEDNHPNETKFEEAYIFRFNPGHGFGVQFSQIEGDEYGQAYHIKNDSTFLIDKGYHPCVAAPGYQMYYFTVIVGKSTRSLIQHFQPEHAYQIETIPGIKDMIAGFK